jgi:hypothetical protein
MANAVKVDFSPLSTSTEPEIPRQAGGRFPKGHKKVGGRKKGSGNKFPKSVIEQIVAGIARSVGGAGVEDFACKLATANPASAASLLSKIAHKTEQAPAAVTQPSTIDLLRIVNIPSGHCFRAARNRHGERIEDEMVLIPPAEAFRLVYPGLRYPFATEEAAAEVTAPEPAPEPIEMESAPALEIVPEPDQPGGAYGEFMREMARRREAAEAARNNADFSYSGRRR